MSLESGVQTRVVDPGQWVEEVRQARSEGFDFFDWLTAVDHTDLEDDPGFDVVVHLIATGSDSPRPLSRIMLRTRIPSGAPLGSLTGVFAGAAWAERETHEMFAIEFTDFEDATGQGMRPLLLPDGFEGHPLRKEFVLAARASKPWPGAKDPGESEATPKRRSNRRRLLPPGVPDPSWGPR